MLAYSDRQATLCWAKSGPPCGSRQEARRTASRRWHGLPARTARRSLPTNFLTR